MKHIRTFTQHLNESNEEPNVIDGIEWRRVNDRSHIPQGNKEKLKELCDLAGYEKEEWSKIYRIAKSIGYYAHTPPAVTFVRSADGTYYLETMNAEKSSAYYKSTSFDDLLQIAIDTINPQVVWFEIR
jgi:hypothetical protein